MCSPLGLVADWDCLSFPRENCLSAAASATRKNWEKTSFIRLTPGGVLEGVFVVEGDEEAENGEEHDEVADDH